jgi:hypothetical protein
MTLKQKLCIALDIAMTILLVVAYAYRIIGDIAHEWIGVSVFVLFIAHNFINSRWYKNIGRGAYTARRVILTTVNALLALTMVTLFVTGFMQSRIILSFLNLPGSMVLRQIHTTAAYWGLPLIGVHIGLHWGIFTKFISKNRLIICITRILAFLFAVFGVWSSFDRDLFSKLFLGFSFDYWSEERPAVLFFVVTLSIMAVYVFMAYYTLKILECRRRNGVSTKPPKVD